MSDEPIELCIDLAIRFASCVRDFTPSLRNTLRRWYSTVLGLMKSCEAISRFVRPSATRRAICASRGGDVGEGVHRPPASVLASRLELAARSLGQRLHS